MGFDQYIAKTGEITNHSAICHFLDVGSVARSLLELSPVCASSASNDALAGLVALHDLGKISASFQAMLRDGRRQAWRHWKLTDRLLNDLDAKVAARIGGEPRSRTILYAAVAGHHGGPPSALDGRKKDAQRREIGDEAMLAAAEALEIVFDLFPDACLEELDQKTARRLSWSLAGLTTEADWIGSNQDWFPPAGEIEDLAGYAETARLRAERAVEAAGLGPSRAVTDPFFLPANATPRPMQSAAAAAPLPEGPGLAIVEDATGAGKTEAALILTARMIAAGKAAGVFFALPTMATANAMFARMEAAATRLFKGRPSLSLAHSGAALSERFRAVRGRQASSEDPGPSCGPWLADDRRRALFADLGVGTVDQALLAVLPTRFNTLRLRALADKVLIVDEAHSYNPYMEAQLQRLLTFHAIQGGSAIVMTATLPLAMRARLADAFQAGAGAALTPAYPALSLIGDTVASEPVQPAGETVRRVAVRRIAAADEAVERIAAAAKAGAACIWVRNAVDDAIAAVEALRAAGLEADLLHARFAMGDRLCKEAALAARFGKAGTGRAGRVLVATQVAEASLDWDFDVMVSDLAPIGALIQRAGRLWRHMAERPAASRPAPGPELLILSPDPGRVADARWLHGVLDAGAYVYPAGVQWRTARALFAAGAIDAPGGLRDLIEAVHGDDAPPVPAPLEREEAKTEGDQFAEKWKALENLLDPDKGYAHEQTAKVFDEEAFPTRLGQPQVTLALARRKDGQLSPWIVDALGWALSEVSMSARRYERLPGVDQSAPEIAAAKADWPEWRREHVVLAPVGEDGAICEGLRYDAEMGLLIAR